MFVSQFFLCICFLSNSKGNPIIMMESESSTKSEIDGRNLSLNIFVSGNPEPSADNITWYLNNELLTSELANSKGFDIFVAGSSTLILTVHPSIEGYIQCQVTTSAGTATASHILGIHCELMCHIKHQKTLLLEDSHMCGLVSIHRINMYLYTNLSTGDRF